LRDDYTHDGRVLFEFTDQKSGTSRDLLELARIYKQLNAPVGTFGLGVLQSTTKAIKHGDAAAYMQQAAKLDALGKERDGVAQAMRAVLEGAASGNTRPVDNVDNLITRGRRLLAEAGRLKPQFSSIEERD
jgi:hypothetical protein